LTSTGGTAEKLYIPYMAKEQDNKVAKGVAELLEELKKGPKIPGVEPVKVLKQREFMELDPKVVLYVPFAPTSDFKPADAYIDDVRKIAKPGIEKDYLLLASVRKLSENYKSRTVFDFTSYIQDGMTEDIAKDEEKRNKKLQENVQKHNKTLENIVKNTDNAWTDPKTPAIVTPAFVFSTYDDATNVMPDDEDSMMFKNSTMLKQFVMQHGSMRDKENYLEGKCFYAARYKEVKDDKGKKGMAFDHVEIWQKKK